MRVAIHQPNYFPWLGYFHKLAKSDLFIILDDDQFPKGSWTNRCRIKTPQGANWLTVPVKKRGRFGQKINECMSDDRKNWKRLHVKTIEQNYRNCRYWDEIKDDIFLLYLEKSNYLASFNITIINELCGKLAISTPIIHSSSLGISGKSTTRLIKLIKAVGGKSYLCGMGSSGYLDREVMIEEGIKVENQAYEHLHYRQPYGAFAPGLSILDVVANIGWEETQSHLYSKIS